MKILMIMLGLVSFIDGAHIDKFASEMNYSRDYASALAQAKKEKKLLMILVVGDYCPWCKKFERKTMKRADVDAVVKEDFVPLILDKYKDKGKYPDKFYSPVIPSVYFVNPQGEEILHQAVAYMKKDEFLDNLDDGLMAYDGE